MGETLERNRGADRKFTLVAMVAAFVTYFCMYAFRKPFSAATYEGVDLSIQLFGRSLDPKTVFVIAQVLGYCCSKYLGTKYCAEVKRANLGWALMLLIGVGWLSLLLFAVLPVSLKVAAIFCNGVPLGLLWGLVVRFLEGRRVSELLLAGMSCSYILASGEVKRVGRWLMNEHQVAEFWMPFVTGAIFLVPIGLSIWALTLLPSPTAEDEELRTKREPMGREERWRILHRYMPGMVLLSLSYLFLTAYRDFRDNYQADLFQEMGILDAAAFSRTERPVALGVLLILGLLFLIRNNRKGLTCAYGIMITGLVMMGVSTFLYQQGSMGGEAWMIWSGLGVYLAYVPYGSVLFERIIAVTRFSGTAVFAIYVIDALGYTGSVGLQLYKDLFAGEKSRLDFFVNFTTLMAWGGIPLMLMAMVYFLRQKPNREG